MAISKAALLLTLLYVVNAQRPTYAGLRPIGYPEIRNENQLFNRFGDDADAPIEVKGPENWNIVNRIQSMPQDKQPFWYLNWRQYDALRRNPQTYPQRPSVFVENRI